MLLQVPPGPYTIPRYGRYLNVELVASLPQGCGLGDAALPTTFLSGQVPTASTLEGPFTMVTKWAYDSSMRTVWGQEAVQRAVLNGF